MRTKCLFDRAFMFSLTYPVLFFLSPVPPNTTEVQTKHNDIAHFTCTTRLLATISWKKETKDINNEELGLEILSYNESGAAPFLKSHLLVAVTDDDLRGKYECFSSDDPRVAMKTFFIKSKENFWYRSDITGAVNGQVCGSVSLLFCAT